MKHPYESVLQRSWDRELSGKPVLLILVGSDPPVMEALTSHGRPFHQRGTQLTVGPLNPAEVAAMAAGGIAHSTLTRAADLLISKGVGSVKWLETGQFDARDLVALQRHRDRVTAGPVPLIAVSRSGASSTRADAAFTPAGLIEAW